MQANERLHQLIVSVGSSATAERMLEQLQLPKVRTLFFRVMSPVIWRASRDDHLAILTAIIDGDEDRAEHAMRDHVRQTATLFAGLPESSFACVSHNPDGPSARSSARATSPDTQSVGQG